MTMEKINDFESVLNTLKNEQVVLIESPIRTNFSLRNQKVFVKTIHAQYFISVEEFEELFKHSIFYLYESKQNSEVEILKDEEYYAWKHK